MAAPLRRYPAEILSRKKDRLKILFPHDATQPDAKTTHAPSLGMVAFETLLESKYRDIDFGFQETNAENENTKTPKNCLVIGNELAQFLAIHLLATSPYFFDPTHTKTGAEISNFNYLDNRKLLELDFRNRILTETISPKDAIHVKKVLAEIYAHRYNELKANLVNIFTINKIAYPLELTELVKTIDQLDGSLYDFDMTKYGLLATEIYKLRLNITTPLFNLFKTKTAATLYDEILQAFNFDTLEKKQKLLVNYKRFEDQITQDKILLLHKPMDKKPLDLFENPTIVNLYRKLQDFIEYSEKLKKRGVKKGHLAADLAHNLKAITDRFCKNYMEDPKNLPEKFGAFEQEFHTMLNTAHPSLNDHRFNFKTFLKNILVALTVVGILVILGKLIVNKMKKQKALPFFCQEKSTTQERLEAVKASFNLV